MPLSENLEIHRLRRIRRRTLSKRSRQRLHSIQSAQLLGAGVLARGVLSIVTRSMALRAVFPLSVHSSSSRKRKKKSRSARNYNWPTSSKQSYLFLFAIPTLANCGKKYENLSLILIFPCAFYTCICVCTKMIFQILPGHHNPHLK